MAKTLIIKGASYTANKLTTVTFTSVPCTGISFSTNTFTLTGYGQQEIEYTLTPSDTTYEVTWASSNTNIVTVSEGVMTVVGVGTCTVTATCGSYSASATVTVTMQANYNLVQYLPAVSALSTSHTLYYSTANNTRAIVYGAGDQAGEYKIYDAGTPANSVPVIKIPGNTGRIKISITNTAVFNNSSDTRLYWLKDESAQWSSYADAAYFDSMEDLYNITTNTEKVYTVPSGINAISFSTRFASGKSSAADAKATLEAAGFKIEFLPPAS